MSHSKNQTRRTSYDSNVGFYFIFYDALIIPSLSQKYIFSLSSTNLCLSSFLSLCLFGLYLCLSSRVSYNFMFHEIVFPHLTRVMMYIQLFISFLFICGATTTKYFLFFSIFCLFCSSYLLWRSNTLFGCLWKRPFRASAGVLLHSNCCVRVWGVCMCVDERVCERES